MFSASFNNLSGSQQSLLVFSLSLLLQLPLILNSGYFSHDELQWAARADVPSWLELPWLAWLDYKAYQYRPVTFNLWLLLSHHLFDQPYLFHSMLVIWGSLHAVILFNITQKLRFDHVVAFMAALAFVTSPYALYVHGWVATLADLLVMTCVLLMAWFSLKSTHTILLVMVTMVFTSIALLSKESALAIPGIFVVAWLLVERKKSWLVVALASGLVVTAYLALRLPVLLSQPDETHYILGALNLPIRWLEYQMYWVMPHLAEPNAVFSSIKAMTYVAGLLVLLFWLLCARSQLRLTLALLLGGFAALSPVLPIASSAGQYGYLFSAWSVLCISAIWQVAAKWTKRFIVLLAGLSILHGVVIMVMFNRVGQIQSVYSPALAQLVSQSKDAEPIQLTFSPAARVWIFERLSHQLEVYQGVKMKDRVVLTNDVNEADFVIMADGQIKSAGEN